MEMEPLIEQELVDWEKLQKAFKQDWPRGCPAYYILETQREWLRRGLDYGFKVFCPYGQVRHGMVALNYKKGYHELVIQCPTDDTDTLEDALTKTKLIDWTHPITIPFAQDHIIECVRRLADRVHVKIDYLLMSHSYIMDTVLAMNKDGKLFDVSLPDDIIFAPLKPEHVEVVDSNWNHRYKTSPWYFQQLIKADSGYGLFKNGLLIAWVFIYEYGSIGNLYTVESQRRKGYAEILVKILCNRLFNDGKDVFVYTVKGNHKSCKLFSKIGFTTYDKIAWCYLKPEDRRDIVETAN